MSDFTCLVFEEGGFDPQAAVRGLAALRESSPIPQPHPRERLVMRPLSYHADHPLKVIFYLIEGWSNAKCFDAQWETFQIDELPRFISEQCEMDTFLYHAILWSETTQDLIGYRCERDRTEIRSIVGDEGQLIIEDVANPKKSRSAERDMPFRGKRAFGSRYSATKALEADYGTRLLTILNAWFMANYPQRYDPALREQNVVLCSHKRP